MASQQMVDRLQPVVAGIPPSKRARLDSTNSETSGRPEPFCWERERERGAWLGACSWAW